MTAEVVDFTGHTTLDLPADKVLSAAIGALSGCVVIGITQDGDEYFAASFGDHKQVLWLLERMKAVLLESPNRHA